MCTTLGLFPLNKQAACLSISIAKQFRYHKLVNNKTVRQHLLMRDKIVVLDADPYEFLAIQVYDPTSSGLTPIIVTAPFSESKLRSSFSLTEVALNNHLIVALGKAVTGQRIFRPVPTTVVTFPPITIVTSFSPLIATAFSSGLVI